MLRQDKKVKWFMLALLIFLGFNAGYAAEMPISLFPIENYSQQVSQQINPAAPNYRTPLIDAAFQQARLQEFYKHYFSSAEDAQSPWSAKYVSTLLQSPSEIIAAEKEVLDALSNIGKEPQYIGYGINFRPLSPRWFQAIQQNMNLNQFISLHYSPKNRAIATQNLYARSLPTNTPDFYAFTLPGQGYPFDNLQNSAVWAGTPLYVLGESADGVWDLVLTPNLVSWVEASGVGRTSEAFIKLWQRYAFSGHLAAIVKTQTPLKNNKNQTYFDAYVGSVFPVTSKHSTVLVPVRQIKGDATLEVANAPSDSIVNMPLAPTPENFAKLISTLIGRPYGWGGLYFYNDCSQELKSLFTPFGIYLPRNSAQQVSAGKSVDVTKMLPAAADRIAYLAKQGHPFMTIIYIGGHIMLYVGNNSGVPLTYQNAWGLSPMNGERRAVIGGSVFLPLLEHYPEDPSLNSPANKKYFELVYLDQWPQAGIQSVFPAGKSIKDLIVSQEPIPP